VIRAEAADAAQMAELLRELGYANQAEDVTRRLSQMDARREWVLVATEDERLVGLAAYAVIPWFASDGAHCRVSAMGVAEGARSRGVGAALLDAVETQARDLGCTVMEVTSGEQRLRAHAFYERHGYRPTSRRFLKALRPPS